METKSAIKLQIIYLNKNEKHFSYIIKLQQIHPTRTLAIDISKLYHEHHLEPIAWTDVDWFIVEY